MKEFKELKKIHDECLKLVKGRNKKYSNSWKVLTIKSIANMCEMKMNRFRKLDVKDVKAEDEFKDTINYCVFALWKLKNKDV